MFDSLIRAYHGEGWPVFDMAQERFIREYGTSKKTGWVVYNHMGMDIQLREVHGKTSRVLNSGKYKIVKVNEKVVYQTNVPEVSRAILHVGLLGAYLEWGHKRLWAKHLWDPEDEVFDFFVKHYRTISRVDFHDEEGGLTEKSVLWAFCHTPFNHESESYVRTSFNSAWESGNFQMAFSHHTRYVKILSRFYHQIRGVLATNWI